MPTSKAIKQLEERMSGITPGTLRYEALEAAKRFKSSWIALGRVLWAVWKEKKFREWGYLTFDAYCAKEIGIRSATAKKLLHSYYFLEQEEPSFLKKIAEESPSRLPHADAVNVLRLLSKQKGALPNGYQELRHKVLERGLEAPQARQEVRMLLQEAQPDPAAARAERQKAILRRMVGTLKSMKIEMEADRVVPQKLLDQVSTLIKSLEDLQTLV